MKWDEVNDRPITAEEMDLDALLDDDMDWVANLDEADIAFGARDSPHDQEERCP
jgi:hypothetical protein